METIQVLSFFALVLIVIIGALLLFILWKFARIMGKIYQQKNEAETQFNGLREEVMDFTQSLSPFFAGGGIEDILRNKRATEESQAQDQS